MPDKKKLSDKDLEKVTGGGENPTEIKVKIKTLDGDNDDYKIKLSDTAHKLIERYSTEQK